jgi:hypothetical protein
MPHPPTTKTIPPSSSKDEKLTGPTKQSSFLNFRKKAGLLRGACHRARIRAIRWLAMTCNNILAARCVRVLQEKSCPMKTEGAGNAGRTMHPQPRVRNKKAHERSHHGHTGNHPAFPAQWFYGLLRALPGDQACLTPSPALLLADLTPASGRQNDTTWPSAAAPFVKGAAASTASRPALMTLRNAPLRDGTESL